MPNNTKETRGLFKVKTKSNCNPWICLFRIQKPKFSSVQHMRQLTMQERHDSENNALSNHKKKS
jgi:hypothetical protein